MDTKAFIASLVSSLAWPAAFVAVALLFREQLLGLLRRRSEPEAPAVAPEPEEAPTFDGVLTLATRELVEAGIVVPAGASEEETHARDVERIVALSPSAAIVEGQLLVHHALQRLVHGDLAFQGADVPTMSLARSAYNRGDIGESLVHAVERLTYLRGLATNYGGGEVVVDRAMDYLALVQAVTYWVEHADRDDGEAPEPG